MTRPAPEIFIDSDFLVKGKEFSPDHNDLSCAEWESFVSTELSSDEASCLDMRDYLAGLCCTDPNQAMPPLFECRSAAERATVQDPNYHANKAPVLVDAPNSLLVEVQVLVYNSEIEDYGVDGGAISVWGEFDLRWVDPRLQFQDVSQDMNCFSFSVDKNDVWTPSLRSKQGTQLVDLPDNTQVTVLADGRIESSFWGRTSMRCSSLPGAAKQCSLSWADDSGDRNVIYKARESNGVTNGVVVTTPDSMPPSGYKLNSTATKVAIYSDETLGPSVQVVDFVVHFDPLERVRPSLLSLCQNFACFP